MASFGPDLEFSMLRIRKNDSKVVFTDLVESDDADLVGNRTFYMIRRGANVMADTENVSSTVGKTKINTYLKGDK